jgi:hypothetical protein
MLLFEKFYNAYDEEMIGESSLMEESNMSFPLIPSIMILTLRTSSEIFSTTARPSWSWKNMEERISERKEVSWLNQFLPVW